MGFYLATRGAIIPHGTWEASPAIVFQHIREGKFVMKTLKPFDRITVDSAVMNGRPCIRGMRVQVSLILNLAANGMTMEDITKSYPYIEPEDISQCLRYASWLAEDRIDLLAEA